MLKALSLLKPKCVLGSLSHLCGIPVIGRTGKPQLKSRGFPCRENFVKKFHDLRARRELPLAKETEPFKMEERGVVPRAAEFFFQLPTFVGLAWTFEVPPSFVPRLVH